MSAAVYVGARVICRRKDLQQQDRTKERGSGGGRGEDNECGQTAQAQARNGGPRTSAVAARARQRRSCEGARGPVRHSKGVTLSPGAPETDCRWRRGIRRRPPGGVPPAPAPPGWLRTARPPPTQAPVPPSPRRRWRGRGTGWCEPRRPGHPARTCRVNKTHTTGRTQQETLTTVRTQSRRRCTAVATETGQRAPGRNIDPHVHDSGDDAGG